MIDHGFAIGSPKTASIADGISSVVGNWELDLLTLLPALKFNKLGIWGFQLGVLTLTPVVVYAFFPVDT